MKTTLKIALIGSTGKAGKYLAKELAIQGIQCKLLVRNSTNQFSKTFEIIEGDIADYQSVVNLVHDCHVVISMLGMGILPNPTNIFSIATVNIIKAMKEYNISRYILITGLNVDTPFDDKGVKSKMATEWMHSHYPKTTKDKQEEYTILRESDIDWTLIRLPLIDQTDDNPAINISLKDCPGTAISATSLANFIIRQINDKTFIREAPFIANI